MQLPPYQGLDRFAAYHLLLTYLAAESLLYVETETAATAPFWLYARGRNKLRVLERSKAWKCHPGDETAWEKAFKDFQAANKKGDWDISRIINKVAKNYVRHLNEPDEAIAFVIAHPDYEWPLWQMRNHALSFQLDDALTYEHNLRQQLKSATQPLRKLRLKLALARASRKVAWCKVRTTVDLRAAALKLAKTEELVT